MPDSSRKLVIIILACILIVPGTGCSQARSTVSLGKTTVAVERGNLDVTISVDGNLNMPEVSDLHFGAAGNVKEVNVKAGDTVKAGMIMATLDDTSEALDIRKANNAVQNVLKTLYLTIPTLNQRATLVSQVGFPNYYPSSTAVIAYNWARDEIGAAHDFYLAENYTAAVSSLYLALSDLESCSRILIDTVNNPDSGLGNTAPFVPADLPGIVGFELNSGQSSSVLLIVELRAVADLIKRGQTEVQAVSDLTTQGKLEEAAPRFEALLSQIDDIGSAVYSNVAFIKTNGNSDIYGRDISLYFFYSAEAKLKAAMTAIEKVGLNSPDISSNLILAEHDMKLCNAIMGVNDSVLQNGLSLKTLAATNLSLASAMASLKDSKDAFLNTVIMAPFDGTVVSVAAKADDVLGEQDFASKDDIQIVDTTQIEFKGTVDEIDITKIKTGQKATISVDAVSGKKFTGTVTFISPYGTTSGNIVKFNITIGLDPTDVDLKGGLTASADINVTSIENALLVPVSAVTAMTDGTSSANLLDSATGKTIKTTITIGGQNQQYDEVLSGLKEGDKVVVEQTTTGAPVTTDMGPGGAGGAPPSGGGGAPPSGGGGSGGGPGGG